MTTEQRTHFNSFLAALRSGEYQQGYGALQTQDGRFCCLGVTCDLYVKETGAAGWIPSANLGIGIPGQCLVINNLDDVGILPGAVKEYFGLSEANPLVTVDEDETDYVASMNDSGNYSFAEIADALEKAYAEQPEEAEILS